LQLTAAASTILKTHGAAGSSSRQPGNAPLPEMMAPGESYLPEGVGCTQQPKWSASDSFNSFLTYVTPAMKFKNAGWNGFCQMGWPLCPDAVANQDYSYYWKGLGPSWVKGAGDIDAEYCRVNGWLKPEIRSIARNFTALQALGEEQCKTKWSKPEFNMDGALLYGVVPAILTGIQETSAKILEHPLKTMMKTNKGNAIMTEKAAGMTAAWNCALGSVSCDIAYCNYGYCEKSDGTVGIMDECEGWDEVRKQIV